MGISWVPGLCTTVQVLFRPFRRAGLALWASRGDSETTSLTASTKTAALFLAGATPRSWDWGKAGRGWEGCALLASALEEETTRDSVSFLNEVTVSFIVVLDPSVDPNVFWRSDMIPTNLSCLFLSPFCGPFPVPTPYPHTCFTPLIR